MKKKILTIILILIVPIFLTACTKKGTSSTNQASKETSTKKDDSLFSGSMMDLLNRGKNSKCTFSYEEDGYKMSGVSYISGDKMYGESTMSVQADGEDMDIESYTVIVDNTMYTWSSMMEGGMMMNLDDAKKIQAPEGNDETDQKAMKNIQKEIDFDCKPWVVDNSKFKVPEDIAFMDMMEMYEGLSESVEKMEESMEGMTEAACKACNSLPAGTQREECLADLDCE